MDPQGHSGAEEQEAVEADAPGQDHRRGRQSRAEEAGEGPQGASLGGSHRPRQGEEPHGDGHQRLGARHLEEAGLPETEAQVDHIGDGVEAGELEEGKPQQGGSIPRLARRHSAPRRYSAIWRASRARTWASRRTNRRRTPSVTRPPVSRRAALGRNIMESIPAVRSTVTVPP